MILLLGFEIQFTKFTKSIKTAWRNVLYPLLKIINNFFGLTTGLY
tara:strand:- start:16807 stop:16941 length:135 start_codon:yes stop_codon:yes gene_type:complete